MELVLPKIEIPHKALFFLNEHADFKGLYGGRGGAKSWSAATALIARAASEKLRILCAREFQSSIKDSVHYLLVKRIDEMGLNSYFDIQKNEIFSHTGSSIFYRGLSRNLQEIKSTEDLDIVWIEEAHFCSDMSLEVLEPTVRKAGSEIWLTWNPLDDEAPVQRKFVINKHPGAIVRKIGWQDNPFFPEKMERSRELWRVADPDTYDHVWEGATRRVTAASIFRGKWQILDFPTPANARFYHGADWGFANDPTALIRSFTGPAPDKFAAYDWENDESCLYIDQEVYLHGLEIDHIPAAFDAIPSSRQWPIYGDSSRPETISYVSRCGFNILPADKWEGCVEDGIEHLKGFKQIYIHPRCVNMAMEARLYSFKIDPKTEDVLPIVVDKNNHAWDAVRYSLNGLIQQRGDLAMWAKLAKRRGQV